MKFTEHLLSVITTKNELAEIHAHLWTDGTLGDVYSWSDMNDLLPLLPPHSNPLFADVAPDWVERHRTAIIEAAKTEGVVLELPA